MEVRKIERVQMRLYFESAIARLLRIFESFNDFSKTNNRKGQTLHTPYLHTCRSRSVSRSESESSEVLAQLVEVPKLRSVHSSSSMI